MQKVLPMNPLDDYLEELNDKGDKEKVSTSPLIPQVIYVETNLSPSVKKKKSLMKLWWKANEKLKTSMNIMLLPPREVDHLYFDDRGELHIFSCLSMNFPCGNVLQKTGGNSPPFNPT